MNNSKGYVTVVHLFLSALVGLGGMGAVVSFQHASDLLNGMHLFTNVSANDDVHDNEPTPTPSPIATPTPTVIVVDPSVSPTPTPTIVPTVSPAPLRIQRLDDEELDDDADEDDNESEDRVGAGVLGQIRGLFGNHIKSGQETDHD